MRRIPRGRKITASDLHQQLKDAGIERDLRTIQRQLEMLSKHFEIERDDRSKPYGYSWLEQAKAFAVPNLTPQESLLLQLAEEHLKHLLPARLIKSLDSFFTQAKRNLGTNSNARLAKEWPSKVRVIATSQPLLPPKIAAGVFDAVSEALYSNRWILLDYKNASGKRNSVEVMPLGLVQQGTRLYVVCRFQGFDNERNLAIHRIVSAKMLTLTFERPQDFDLQKYDDDGRFGFGDGKRIQLTFFITEGAGFHLLESPLSTDQKTKLVDGGYEITANVVQTAQLDWWLRGFGKQIWNVRNKVIVAQKS